MTTELDDREIKELLRHYVGMSPMMTPHKDAIQAKYAEFSQILTALKANVSGEVLSAFARKEIDYQRFGEYVSDPTAVYTDGHALGYEDNKASGTKVTINIAVDGSESMSHADGCMESHTFNPHWNQEPNEEGIKNPLLLAPRMFYASLVARYIRRSLMEVASELQRSLEVNSHVFAIGGSGEIVEQYAGGVWLKHPNEGGGTPLSPVLSVIKKDEESSTFVKANRMDLIITDGLFQEYLPAWQEYRESAESTQYERMLSGSTINTVVLNLMPEDKYYKILESFWKRNTVKEWESGKNWTLPFSTMYFVDSPQTLAQVFAMSLQDFFRRL